MMTANPREYIKKGNGHPIILLHSSMSDKSQWAKLMDTVSNDFQAISIDLYGYGASSFPCNSETFSLTDETNRIDTIISNLLGHKSSFHLIGHSYGAAAALRYTYENLERVESLAIYEPVAFHLLDTNEPTYMDIVSFAHHLKDLVAKKEKHQATEQFVDFWSGQGTYANLNKARKSALNCLINKVILDFQAGINDSLRLEDYRTICTSTCILAGKKSKPVTQKIAIGLTKSLPNVQFHWVDGGHMAPISEVEQVNTILVDFVDTFK